VAPDPAADDQALGIRLTGLAPGQPAMLSAQFTDATGAQWDAEAAFRADGRGVVDVATQAPIAGTYSGVQPMGLIWSASPSAGFVSPQSFTALSATSPPPVTVVATVGGRLIARAILTRYTVAPGVTATTVRAAGLYGELYRPGGAHSVPGVLLLGGSEGGLNPYLKREAALLADHGYAALALAYFGAPGLLHTLTNIPLEYVGRALGWLGRQPGVRGDRLAVVGHSRGGELALLLGAHDPRLKAVVSYVGSGLVFGSTTGRDNASWTWHGVPIAPRTVIPVERINGPVLLLAAADDKVWPSAALSQVAVDRLRHAHHPYADQLVVYLGAGHFIEPPYLPTSAALPYDGGNTRDQAVADADAWSRTLRTLDRRLGVG